MDHHKQAGARAEVTGFEDQYYYGRRSAALYVPRFRNISEKRSDYIRGFGLLGDATRQGWPDYMLNTAIGSELKENVQHPGPWEIAFQGYGEHLPYQDNRITLNTDLKDKWGRNTLTIDCEFKENEKAMQGDMAASAAEMLEAAGYKNVSSFVTNVFSWKCQSRNGNGAHGKRS